MLILSTLILLAWLYLWLGHGKFWSASIPSAAPEPSHWPSISVIVPARNEAETIAETVRGILGQDYPGELHLVVVDDHSEDNTAELAHHAARLLSKEGKLTVLEGQTLPEGWAGKVWAMQQGWEEARKTNPDFIWFTDADIWHEPQALRGLAAGAVEEGLGLNSAMVELHCEGFWEKLLVPAFVYFFKLLYPFKRVNDPESKVAGAAGGSMLAKANILETIKGPSAIKGELIDDCALARAIQNAGGRLRLELTRDSRSLRGYPSAAEAWNTIARTAYTQLNYNPWLLLGSVFGLGLLFIAPALSLFSLLFIVLTKFIWGTPHCYFELLDSHILLWISFLLMTASIQPMLRFYRVSTDWALLLPFITCFYLGATLDSARRYYAGSGGRWKGRTVKR